MYCPNCGKKVQESWNVCSECGYFLVRKNVDVNSSIDLYMEQLQKNRQKELIGQCIAAFWIVVLCGLVVINNIGYQSILGIFITCVLVMLVIVAVYNAVAEYFGIYKAGEKLNKYCKLKMDVGHAEAIKIMEQAGNSKEGYTMLKTGVKGGYEITKDFIKGILGFVCSVLLLIIVISLC